MCESKMVWKADSPFIFLGHIISFWMWSSGTELQSSSFYMTPALKMIFCWLTNTTFAPPLRCLYLVMPSMTIKGGNSVLLPVCMVMTLSLDAILDETVLSQSKCCTPNIVCVFFIYLFFFVQLQARQLTYFINAVAPIILWLPFCICMTV